jgi:hypothetical protein
MPASNSAYIGSNPEAKLATHGDIVRYFFVLGNRTLLIAVIT